MLNVENNLHFISSEFVTLHILIDPIINTMLFCGMLLMMACQLVSLSVLMSVWHFFAIADCQRSGLCLYSCLVINYCCVPAVTDIPRLPGGESGACFYQNVLRKLAP